MWRGIPITTLRSRLVFYVAIALIPLVFLSMLSQSHARALRREAIIRNSLSIASATALAVRNFIENVQGMENAAAIAFATGSLPMENADAYLEEMRLTNPHFAYLVILDADGRVIASDRRHLIGRDYSDSSWYIAIAREDQQRHVSELFLTQPEREPVFVVATGARMGETLRLVFAGAIDPMALEDLTATHIPDSGDIGILDSKGHVVASNITGLRREGIVDRTYVPGVSGAIQGDRGTFVNWRDPLDDVVRIGAAVPVRTVGWAVVHMQPQAEAMRPVMTAQNRDLAALVLFGTLSLFLAWFLGGRITEPLRLLTEDAAQLSAGDMSVRSSIVRRDEIGQLANSFNAMASNLEVLSLVSHTATSLLYLHPLLDAVAGEVCSTTGFDLCTIALLDERGQHLFFAGLSKEHKEIRRFRRDELGTTICGAAVVAKRPVIIEDCEESDYPCRQMLALEEIASAASVPITSGDTALGALTVYSFSRRSISETQVRLLSSVAGFAAIGIQNARIYERERRIAVTLQRSFLPEIPDRIGQFDIGHLYKPALGEAELGGDFYDFFTIREGVYGVVIGDVAGKGLSAALTAVMAIYVLRAFAAEDSDPSTTLLRVNDALWRYIEAASFVTIFYGVLDLAANEIVFASAGHEPPIVYSARSDRVEWRTSHGTAAGVVTGGDYDLQRFRFEQGDVLLLYTDGVVDSRNDGEFFGQNGLEAAAIAAAGSDSAQALIDVVLHSIIDFSDGRQRDDIAMLAIRRS